MLSKCANPGCGTRFRYLNEGMVYLAEWPHEGDTCDIGNAAAPARKPMRRREMFWLCSTCNRKLTLITTGSRVIAIARELVTENDERMLRALKIAG